MTQTSRVLVDTTPYLHGQTSEWPHPFIRRELLTQDHLERSTGGTAGVFDVLAQIDREISQLKQVRALLERSRSLSSKALAKRDLTPEGRRRIAAAAKRRGSVKKSSNH